MFDFISDLDEYFCKKFANYDMICGLPGYRMPTMQAVKTDEYGRRFAYTLPKTTLCLANQEQKTELLRILKEKLVERDFSFSFRASGFGRGFRHRFSQIGFKKTLERVAARNNLTFEQCFQNVNVSQDVVKGLKKGKFLPTKNLMFSIALAEHFSEDDLTELMMVCYEDWDYAHQKDVVIRYLLEKRIFNEEMVKAALEEYKVKHLFLNFYQEEKM